MYVNIFLCPLLDIYADMQHSYIVELKYARYKDLENCVEELHREAVEQANRYADTETVKKAIGNTQLHKIVVVYKDYYSLCHPSGTLFPISSNIFRYSLPHASIIRMMGTSDSPSSVRKYSVFIGTVSYTTRRTTPTDSNSPSCCTSTRCVAPFITRWNSTGR